MNDRAKTYNLQSLNFLRNCYLKVGILGGSFYPAHDGHITISKQALKIFNFDYIIWLVALQNPRKNNYKFDIFSRAQQAANIAKHPKILVSTAELDIGSNQTYNVLKRLKELFPTINFTFIMGADNLSHFHTWYQYKEIPKLSNIIVFNRPNLYGHLNFNRFTMKFKAIIDKKQTSPIIIYHGIMLDISSTMIRKNHKDIFYSQNLVNNR